MKLHTSKDILTERIANVYRTESSEDLKFVVRVVVADQQKE